MSKSKKNIIIMTLIITAIVIIFIMLSKNEGKDRVLNIYKKMSSEQNFTFSMEANGEDLEYKVSMSQNGSDVSIDCYSNTDHTTTLIVNNEVFYIDHNNKEYYYDYETEGIDADIIISSLKSIVQKDYIKGREELNGKKYYYQEYNNDNADFIIFANVNEESSIKTKFYFDEDNIEYIKNIIETDGEIEEEIVKVNLKYEAQEDLFELPEDYAEVED